MSRLSCVFCIITSRADLRTAAQLQPALCHTYAGLERRIGHTLSPSGVPLPDLTGVPVPSADSLDALPLLLEGIDWRNPVRTWRPSRAG